jgi:two-component system chemotaxis response regulator CheY
VRILVVDDSAVMRRIILRVLADAGFRDNVEADHGQTALRVLERGGVELMLTDWNMPVMNGLELVTQVRANRWGLPILMVTTNAAPMDVIQALEAGVNNYVVKPFTSDTLRAKVLDVLGG